MTTRYTRSRAAADTCVVALVAVLTSFATSTHAASPRLNQTWRVEAHNSFWHGSNLAVDQAASGPKQHLLDDVYIDRLRGLELDLHSNRPGRNWRVYHTNFDAGYSLCEVFDDCLRVLRAFHHGNVRHDVFFLHLEAKETGSDTFFDFDEPTVLRLTPEDLDETLESHLSDDVYPFDDNWVFGPEDYYEWCEKRIAAGELPADTPVIDSDLKATLRGCGWPTMEYLRGMFIVTLHGNHANNEDYVYDYSHHDERVIRNMKIFPMASLVGLTGAACSDPGQGGVCNWDDHTVFADVLNLNAADFPDTGPFDGDPSGHVRRFILDGGMVRSNDRNTRVDMANAVRTVHSLSDAHGFNVLATDAPRNMLVNFEHEYLANSVQRNRTLDWTSGCLFAPGPPGSNADRGFFGYDGGCSPEELREENSGIFVSAQRASGEGLGGAIDTIAFVHTARRSSAGSLRAFVSTRTEDVPSHGPSYTGNWGCLMAREDASSPAAPFIAVCRRQHRNSWDNASTGAYLLYRTGAGQATSQIYYDQPDDGHGAAEIQNFFRLEYSEEGRFWTAYIQASEDPNPTPGWAEIPLGSVRFGTALGFVGLATDGGMSPDPFGVQRGEYLFANVKYDKEYLTGADFVLTGLEDPADRTLRPFFLDRSFFRDEDADGAPDWREDPNANGVQDAGETNLRDPDSDDDGLLDGAETTHATDPLDPDSDDDELIDGDEVARGTDPNDPDSDDDGLADGTEVATGTDPLDSDSDDDGLGDAIEVHFGTDPLDLDSDDDGLADGEDVEFIQNALAALPAAAFGAQGNQTAILARLDAIEQRIATGGLDQAIRELELLRTRLDGCGSSADRDDWVVECQSQAVIRTLVDLLIANLRS